MPATLGLERVACRASVLSALKIEIRAWLGSSGPMSDRTQVQHLKVLALCQGFHTREVKGLTKGPLSSSRWHYKSFM